MKQGLMRRRIARCVALFYVLFVVLSDMAGTGASFGAIRTKAAVAVPVKNNACFTDKSAGVSYPADVSITGTAQNNVVTLSITKTSANENSLGKYEIYSVKYNGNEYFSKGFYQNSTTTGLYYDNSQEKWVFVGASSAGELEVQVTGEIFSSVDTTLNCLTMYSNNYSLTPTIGNYYDLSTYINESSNQDHFKMRYYNYGGTISSAITCSGGIMYKYVSQRDGKDYYNAYYGGSYFGLTGEGNPVTSIILAKGEKPTTTVTLGRKPGTNEFYMESSSGALTSAFTQISQYGAKSCDVSYDYSNDGKLYYVGLGTSSCSMQCWWNNDDIKCDGQIPDDVVIVDDYSGKSNNNGKQNLYWYGPKSSELFLNKDTTGNITDNLINTAGGVGDYAGEVTKLYDASGNELANMSDDYITITKDGNVTVKKQFEQDRQYKLSTTSKRNVIEENKSDGYELSSSTTEDTWTVSLTLKANAGSSTSESTTTTQATQATTTTQTTATEAPTLTSISLTQSTYGESTNDYKTVAAKPTEASIRSAFTANAVYSDQSKKQITLTTSNAKVVINTPTEVSRESATSTGTKVTYQGSAKITVTQGSISASKTVYYTYSETVANNSYTITKTVTPTAYAGKVTVSAASASYGQSVTVTVADSGSENAKDPTLYVGGKAQTLTNNKAVFTMPDNAVAVEVYYKTPSAVTLTPESSTKNTTASNPAETSGELTNAQLSALYKASGTYKDTKGNTTSVTPTVSVTQAKSTTTTGTTVTTLVTATITATIGTGSEAKKATQTYYYQYSKDVGHSITVSVNPSEAASGVTCSAVKAKSGDSITVTVPVSSLLKNPVVKMNQTELSSYAQDTAKTKRSYIFSMPDQDVSVAVAYTKYNSTTISSGLSTNADIPSNKAAELTKADLLNEISATHNFTNYSTEKAEAETVTLAESNLTLSDVSSELQEDGYTRKYVKKVTASVSSLDGKTVTATYYYSYTKDEGHTVTLSKEQSDLDVTPGLDKTKAAAGKTITVTLPESKKCIDPSVTVKTKAGANVPYQKKTDGITFTMPDTDVTVTVFYQVLNKVQVNVANETLNTKNNTTYENDITLSELCSDYPEMASYTLTYGTSTVKTGNIAYSDTFFQKGTKVKDSEDADYIYYKVPVTVSYSYEGITASPVTCYYYYKEKKGTYQIMLQMASDQQDMENKVVVKQSANQGETVTITTSPSKKLAYAFASVASEDGTIQITELSDASLETGSKKYSFTMPAANVTITVTYQTVSSIACSGLKTAYQDGEERTYEGATLTAYYGSDKDNSITYDLEELVQEGLVTVGEESSQINETLSKDGKTVYDRSVTLTYGGADYVYKYTVEETDSYTVTVNMSPAELSKANVTFSKTAGQYGDEITFTVVNVISEKYKDPVVKIDGKEASAEADGSYHFTLAKNTIITVSYAELAEIAIDTPDDGANFANELSEQLLLSQISAKTVYKRDCVTLDDTKNISLTSDNLTIGEKTKTSANGVVTYKVPVTVTVAYAGVTSEKTFTYTYPEYEVSLEEGSEQAALSKTQVKLGETFTITPASGKKFASVTINGKELSFTDAEAPINVTFTRAYQKTGQGVLVKVLYEKEQGQEITVEPPKGTVEFTKDPISEEEAAELEKDLNKLVQGVTVTVTKDGIAETVDLADPSIEKSLEGEPEEIISADGSYVERIYKVKAVVEDKITYVSVSVKVSRKQTSGDASGDAGKDDNKGNDEPANDPKPATPSTTPSVPQPKPGDNGTDNKDTDVTDQKKELAIPGTVDSMKVTAKKGKITVTWNGVDDATAYEVYISKKKGSGYLKAATVKQNAAKDSYTYNIKQYNGAKLKKNQKYYIKIRAINLDSDTEVVTTNQTVKSKKNGRLYVTVKQVKKAVSYTVKASLKKNGKYKKLFTFDEDGRKKYTNFKRAQKKNKKYFIKVETTIENGDCSYGIFNTVKTIKAK